ncbi:MAG: ADP-heptose synthase / D-glycero-beta-D-manno-heptose 7-phosphate kinase [uncultured Chloroflexi bacterium]|uniref:ADP-heptose synthase / D-glycero-beta-D-manno-heptose 7-phosphate kinase n=1 Tax=uncultured Chloroflexota bacterium TaxID=166587 RepID=A0A6J4ID40_9CHLR|nr:MAG: ADP-heptose synthase / D-glycero-beta-D-manno-heptose 7-phosphate kinase [uncultured Chloroflexota bacterium]
MTDLQRLRGVVEGWRGRRIVVVGDLVADEHVVGRPLAIAREAPVLVLEHVQREVLPGGATNPAANARAMGAEVLVCGVVGDDAAGSALCEALKRRGVDTSGVVVDASRPTTTKTRIWAGGAQQQVQQMMLRLDRVERRPVGEQVTRALVEKVMEALEDADALMLSDYENGVIHPALIEASLGPALANGKTVTVDAHGDLFRFRGATLFTPNQPEAEATLGRRLGSRQELEAGGAELRERLGARAVLVTRGQEGMSLFQAGAGAVHVPAHTAPAADPTGAGDTVAAAFTLAVCAGASLEDAALLANVAASVVVARVGTAVASDADLLAALEGG